MGSAATGSQAARSSASRSPARSCAILRSWCSTRPPAHSTPRPSERCRPRSTNSPRAHDGRDRAPPIDHPRRGPDRSARSRPSGGAGRPRRADGARRALRCDDRGAGRRVGGCLKTTIELTVEVEIERPPSEVWAFMNDNGAPTKWVAEFAAARDEPDGPTGVRKRLHYTLKQGQPLGHLFRPSNGTHRAKSPGTARHCARRGVGLRPRGSHKLAEAGDGRTRVISHYRPELSGLQVLPAAGLETLDAPGAHASAQALKALVEAAPGS